MFSLKFTYWKEKKTTPQNEKRDCKRKGISLGDTWYYTCPCEIKKKPKKLYPLYQLRPANQLSDQQIFAIKFKKTSTVSF